MPVKTKTKPAAAQEEQQEVRLGLMGSGEIAAKSIKVTLAEAIEGIGGTPHFVVPVTKELFSDSVKAVVEALIEADIPYDAVTTPESASQRPLKSFLNNAERKLERQRGFNKFFIQTIGDDGKLLALFDEDDDVLDEVMQLAFAAEIPVLAFNQGLDELEAADEDDETEADDDEVTDEEVDAEVEAVETKSKVKASNGSSNNESVDLAVALRVIGQSFIDASKVL